MIDLTAQLLTNFVSTCDLFSDSVMMIQSGGGNGSTKFELEGEQRMWIKASGYLMSDVTIDKGYATVSLEGVRNILKDLSHGQLNIDDSEKIQQRMTEATLSEARPSIETFLHALLPQRYVLHVHSLVALLYASSSAFIEDLNHPSNDLNSVLLVPYEKPGVNLAMEMKRCLERYAELQQTKGHHAFPKAIVLQNHGLIVASEHVQDLERLVYNCEDQIKVRMGLASTFDKAYRTQLNIKHVLREVFADRRLFVRLCEDKDLQNYQPNGFSFPDAVVFFGVETIMLKTSSNSSALELLKTHLTAYKTKHMDYPRLIVFDEVLYFVGESIKKCMELQDVLKIQKTIDDTLAHKRVVLTEAQSFALLNWEAEKFRKNLG